MANLGPAPVFQFIDNAGEPMFLGKVYTYAAGTDTPLDTYTDSGGGTPNTNPVILDEYGTAPIWFGSASYKIVLKTPADVTIRTVNNFAANLTSGGTGLFADGTVSAPGIAYVNDTNTGIYRTTSPLGVNIALNGTQHTQFKSGQILIPGLGDTSTPNLSFIDDTDTGFYQPNANQMGFVVGGLSGGQILLLDELGATFTLGQILAQQATTASTPQYSFGLSPLTGMYRSAADEISFTNNATKHFTMTADGRFYGTALHNNAGAVTGTTNQYIASGTYTPVATGVTNITSVTVFDAQWMRVGNVVTVSGIYNVNPVASAAFTEFRVTLPIASNFTTNGDLGGSGGSSDVAAESWSIGQDITNDAAVFQAWATIAPDHTIGYTFTYEVK